MRIWLVLFLFVQLAVIAPAPEKPTQDKAAPETSATRPVYSPWRVFDLKFADPSTFSEAVSRLWIHSVPSPAQKFVMVRVKPQLMPAVEELAKRLDVPAAVRKNIGMEISLVEASTEPLQDVATPSGLDTRLCTGLPIDAAGWGATAASDGLVRLLGIFFGYKSVYLL